jgi:hypothetical protein
MHDMKDLRKSKSLSTICEFNIIGYQKSSNFLIIVILTTVKIAPISVIIEIKRNE